MASNQEGFEGFPRDGMFWFVKHIDQFNQAYNRTSSTVVQVMLQQLPPMDLDQLANLTLHDCQEIFGKPGGVLPKFEFVPMLVGYLPAVSTGAVFCDGVKIAHLPTIQLSLSFQPGQWDSEEVEAATKVERPPKWGAAIPHRTLNVSEYSGVSNHTDRAVDFSKSRLVVVRRPRGIHTDVFVIPRMTIFKSFYAQHSDIANAFCANRWSVAMEKIVCLTDLDSGLKTEAIDGGAQWNVILQDTIQDDYARLLAVLIFDDYGRACAESIYGTSLQDRQGKPGAPWYASARIPLRAVTDALELSLTCVQLKSRVSYEGGRRSEVRKLLVTDICGSSWPNHYPEIGYLRTNSNEDGDHVESTELPAPYGGKASVSRESDSETRVSQERDADKNSSTTTVRGNEWLWLGNVPKVIKLRKQRSKKYEAGRHSADDDGDDISAGERRGAANSLPKAEVKAQVRAPNERYERIVDVLKEALSKGAISTISYVRARRPGQATERNGLQCWKLIDEQSLKKGAATRGGWRTIYDKPRSRKHAHWRTALILKLDIRSNLHYWIEIECRKGEDLKSVILSNVGGNRHDILEKALDVIADALGRKLDKKLAAALAADGIVVTAYEHGYTADRKLTIGSVVDVIGKINLHARKLPA
ncbi:hypothetical protein [Massilia scottii]|uniref:hypothetical protein n=1 Tax=Massilia scottii TaxID=3057166 RepID=UPI0027969A00|nr:hypothetical protein [Massilia sp. CCM 9029]MDQ1835227.1 hypothetical protein [Massilia sp. CCM 9029]